MEGGLNYDRCESIMSDMQRIDFESSQILWRSLIFVAGCPLGEMKLSPSLVGLYTFRHNTPQLYIRPNYNYNYNYYLGTCVNMCPLVRLYSCL